jgi:hypothetical protein
MTAPRENGTDDTRSTGTGEGEVVVHAPAGEQAADTSASDADTVGAVTRLLDGLAQRFGGHASVGVVFGDPVTGEGVTVVPVARVAFGLGAGLGSGFGVGPLRTGTGGGGGGSAEARPIGFIELREGAAVYHPIRDPWGDVVMPLAALFLGTTAPLLARMLLGRRGGRGRLGRRG